MDWGKQFGILVQIMRTVAIFAQKRLHKLPLAVIITFCKRTLPKRQMEFVQIDEDTEFEETGFGVLEPLAGKVLQPQEIDLIVVPGVAFTADGKRLGFGGGYYDRYLANYLGQTVSLALTTQLADAVEWPVEDHDVMIGQVVNLEQE